MTFADLGLSEELLRSVATAGYTEPTPIQTQAIPAVLMMRDIIGIAQTGTGKTASFVLPMIDILAQGRRRALMPRSLILEPTRELAAQVAENFEKYGVHHDLKMALLIGGVQMGDQIKALSEGVDVLIATPGRLMDLFERGKILLTGCSMLVIDEADRMLDMGFIPDIEHICTKLPATRQTLLFSATMPAPIKALADRFLENPKHIEVARPATANINIVQAKVAVSSRNKAALLRQLLREGGVSTAIVFCNRKTMVRDLATSLKRQGFAAGEIHGDMDQSSRIAELDRFKDGTINILVASDVAARGLDVKGVSHVFNFDTPWHPDDYVHRIGRTARAGASGHAFTFVTPDDAEAIANIEKLTGMVIPSVTIAVAGAVDGGRDADAGAEAPSARGSRRESRGGSAKSADGKSAGSKNVAEKPSGKASQRRAPRAKVAERAPPRNDTDRATKPSPPERPAPAMDTPTRAAPAPRARPAASKPAPSREPDAGKWNGPVPGFLGFKVGE